MTEDQDRTVRLASIVAIDVVGFSAMSERDQGRTAKAIETLRARIETIAASNGGRVFNTAGDGFMLEFSSAGAALGFIQDLLDKRPRGQPPIRVGAHVGDVVVTITNDLLGHGVNIAARLQSLAVPNTALVSGEFRSMARSSPSVAFQAKGRQPLDNINQRVQTFAILSNGERMRRTLVRGAGTLAAVAALTLLAFFGAHIEQFVQDSHVLRLVGLETARAKPDAHVAAGAVEPKPAPPARPAPIPAAIATPAPAAAPVAPAPALASAATPAARKPGETFRDCPSCPEMIVAPAGRFMMGSPAGERGRFANEGPQREVAVKQIAVSRYEVTFAEWDACLAAGDCGGYSPSDRAWGRGRRPVVGVSWTDAQSYVAWLNKTAGAPVYRLLSEAEWEYVARAGSTAPYATGDRITRAGANFGSRRSDPVGSYAANAFGLYDLAGNAAEWVADCYAQSFAGAPVDGSAVNSPRCPMRVYRGGSYMDPASSLRIANRRRASPAARDLSIGFRIAREIG